VSAADAVSQRSLNLPLGALATSEMTPLAHFLSGDIYRTANLVITRYGCDAIIEAARMVDRMVKLGNSVRRPSLVAPHPVRDRVNAYRRRMTSLSAQAR
jgi:hypothetical protein